MTRALDLLVTGLIALGALALAGLLAGLAPAGELAAEVADTLPGTGVSHPVTAVLLDFRGYDTFLEMAVLLVAVLGVRALGPLPATPPAGVTSPVLDELLGVLTPLLILVAAYLLWIGKEATGGAFQAGAVLGAAGVLVLLAEGRLHETLPDTWMRLLLVAGVAAFAVVGGALVFAGRALLDYPPEVAGDLVFLVETLATLAIGTTLVVLLAGVPRRD